MRDVESIPHNCGVYLFLDKNKNPLYIGKANDLNKRIKSHLKSNEKRTTLFLRKTDNIDYIITNSEIDALLLEDTLIKKHKPKYNIRLKDDKKYPFIKLTNNEEFPRVIFTRKIDEKGMYFGPYTDAKGVRKTLSFIRKIFPLRDCKSHKLPKKECLNFHICRCSGPCINNISKEEYNYYVDAAVEFLKGNTENVEKFVEEKMWNASKNEKFEEAAKWRDVLSFLKEVKEGQNIYIGKFEDADVIGYAILRKTVLFTIFRIRKGRIYGKDNFSFNNPLECDIKEVVEKFIISTYRNIMNKPSKIYIDVIPDNKEELTKITGIDILIPVSNAVEKLLQLAKQNAEVEVSSLKVKRTIPQPLFELQKLLGLLRPPVRIEGFDISNLFGKDAVGSCVVFEFGKPKKSEYRRFKIKTIEGIDDYSMIKEVIKRRLNKILKEEKKMPDLIIIDGGRGQLNTAIDVVRGLKLNKDIYAVGIAKRFEELHLPDGRKLSLPASSSALKLIKNIRDEAHRFAIQYHRKLGLKKLSLSRLDEIEGIGKKRKEALLRHFGFEKKIKEASIEDIMSVKGISKKMAEKIYNFLKGENDEQRLNDNNR